MFKIKIHKLKIVFLIFGLIIISGYSFAQHKKSQFYDFIEKINNTKEKLKDGITPTSNNIVEEDLFNMYIRMNDSSDLQKLNHSVKSTTENLNALYTCSLNESAIANVLYMYDPLFSTTFNDSITSLGIDEIEAPKEKMDLEVDTVCQQFLRCKFPEQKDTLNFYGSKNTVESCIKEITNTYNDTKNNTQNLLTLQKEKMFDSMFWNNNLDDSPYDLMKDFDDIGKIFFDDIISPEESYSFMMYNGEEVAKTIGNTAEITKNIINKLRKELDNHSSDENTGSLLSPINTTLPSSSQSSPKTPPQSKGIEGDTSSILEIGKSGKTNNVTPTSSYTNTTYTIKEYATDLIGDVCILNSAQGNATGTSIGTLGSYLNHGNNGINSNALILDKQQAKKDIDHINKTLGEKSSKNKKSIQKYSCNLNQICEAGESKDCQDCQEYNTSGKTPPIGNIESYKDLQNIKSCVAKCDNQKGSEKFMCILRCSCATFESPFRDGVPGLTNVFRIRLCMVPPRAVDIPSKVKVYSIQSILERIKDTIYQLSISGQLNTQNKTHDALQTENEYINFWKGSNFDFGISFGKITHKKNIRDQKEATKEYNNILLNNILSTRSNISIKNERNKYSLIVDRQDIQANKEGPQSPEEKSALKNKYTNEKKIHDTNYQKLIEQQNQDIIQLNILSIFVKHHIKFWKEFKKMTNSLTVTTKAFLKK